MLIRNDAESFQVSVSGLQLDRQSENATVTVRVKIVLVRVEARLRKDFPKPLCDGHRLNENFLRGILRHFPPPDHAQREIEHPRVTRSSKQGASAGLWPCNFTSGKYRNGPQLAALLHNLRAKNSYVFAIIREPLRRLVRRAIGTGL